MPRYGYLLPTRGSVLTSEDPATLAAKTEADVVGGARRAEAAGFDSVWVGDSVLAKPRHEPLSTLAAVATATDAVGLGTAVHIPPLRDPVVFAHQAATVDQLAGGRLRLGVGVGSGPPVADEYDELGVPFAERGRRLDELLDVATGLWSGESVRYDGAFYAYEDASIGFAAAGDLPVYVASAAFDPAEGFPRAIRERIVAHGDGWLPINLPPASYEAGLAAIRSFLEEAGRPAEGFEAALYRDVVLDADETRAVETARRFYDRYYPGWGELTEDEIRGRCAVGAPAAVAAELEAYAEAGVETFVIRFAAAEQRTQLARFADLIG